MAKLRDVIGVCVFLSATSIIKLVAFIGNAKISLFFLTKCIWTLGSQITKKSATSS